MNSTTFDSPLSLRQLRALLRTARKGFAPDLVAQALYNRDPIVVHHDGKGLAAILKRLIDEARKKLHDDGVEPQPKGRRGSPRLPKRERERTANLSRLLAFYAQALLSVDRVREAEEGVEEGMGWCRAAGDLLEESHLWTVQADICQYENRLVEEEKGLERALDLARKIGHAEKTLFRMCNLVAALITHDKQARASAILQEAMELLPSASEEGRHWILPQLLAEQGRIAALQKKEREAIGTFREALRLLDASHPGRVHSIVLTQLGMAYAGLGEYRQSIEYQRRMLQIAEKENDRIACAYGFLRIGESYSALGDRANAEKAFDLAWDYAPSASRQPKVNILARRGQLCMEDGRIEEGIEYFHRVLSMIPEMESPFLAIFVLLNLAGLEQQRQNLAEAERCLRRALEIGKNTETADRSINVKVRLAGVLLQQKREEEAHRLLREACTAEIRTITDERGVTEAYGLLAVEMERQGDFREALACLRKEKHHALRIAEKHAEEALQKARVLAEVELYEREARLERERRKRMEHELAEVIVTLKNKQRVIGRVERQLQSTLSFLAADKAMEVAGTLKSVLMNVGLEEEGEEHALHYLHATDNEFTMRLRERWPGLTRKQERLCALIRAGLTSQEIFPLLGISYEGLRAQRKRLRKALGLESGRLLETVIAEV